MIIRVTNKNYPAIHKALHTIAADNSVQFAIETRPTRFPFNIFNYSQADLESMDSVLKSLEALEFFKYTIAEIRHRIDIVESSRELNNLRFLIDSWVESGLKYEIVNEGE